MARLLNRAIKHNYLILVNLNYNFLTILSVLGFIKFELHTFFN